MNRIRLVKKKRTAAKDRGDRTGLATRVVRTDRNRGEPRSASGTVRRRLRVSAAFLGSRCVSGYAAWTVPFRVLRSVSGDAPKGGHELRSFSGDAPKGVQVLRSFSGDAPKGGHELRSFSGDAPRSVVAQRAANFPCLTPYSSNPTFLGKKWQSPKLL